MLPKKLTIAGGSHNLTYDADQLLIGVGAMSLAYSAANGLPAQTTLGAVTTSTAFNQYAEPEQRTASFPGGSYAESYERDNAGRVTTRTEQGPSGTSTWSYSYDPSGRLASVVKDGDPYATYTYDANGNRTALTTGSGPSANTTTATFDIRDRMTTQADKSFSHDPDGNLTAVTGQASGTQRTFAYNALGHLTSATTADGKQIRYLLDAAGNRVAKQVAGQVKQGFLYAPGIQGPVAELDGTGAVTARFIYASNPLAPEYIVKNGASYRIIKDQLGSLRLIVDSATGQVAQEITYDPFGRVTSDTNPGFQPFGFAGGLHGQDTGLTHFGAREYSAEMGRWTSSDPISFAGGDANLYGYVLGDPVNFVDPGGLLRVIPTLQEISDMSAGFGDSASLGLTNLLRQAIGTNGVVNKCSGWYAGGGAFGTITSLATGAGEYAQAIRALRSMKFNLAVKPGMFGVDAARTAELNAEAIAAFQAAKLLALKRASKFGAEELGGCAVNGLVDQIDAHRCGC